ncbi:MAG TPA: hypothetical protein VJT13_14065 [Xanthobacteraceae bacterium]|nr:hypothetical protein [Xanthobacteraceae bacterium]
MLKYIAIVIIAATAAQAAPATKADIQDAVKREQRIHELSIAPKSVHNICRGC